MRSPILFLEQAIAASAFNIAPEREKELASARDLIGFKLALSNDRKFAIRVNMETHEATLPIATLEYLWCCSHLFYVLYQEYVKAQRKNKNSLNTSRIPRVGNAIRVLNWSMNNMRNSGIERWPRISPKPKANPKYGSDSHAANEIFLAAIAWIIHHEFAHVCLGHAMLSNIYTIQQEKEADLHATDWILHAPRNSQEAQKRQFGMVTAILAMHLLDRPMGGDSYVGSHPPASQRLDYVLDEAKVGDDSVVCAYAAAALQFQLTQLGVSQELEGHSIRDILGGFMVAFATHGRPQA